MPVFIDHIVYALLTMIIFILKTEFLSTPGWLRMYVYILYIYIQIQSTNPCTSVWGYARPHFQLRRKDIDAKPCTSRTKWLRSSLVWVAVEEFKRRFQKTFYWVHIPFMVT